MATILLLVVICFTAPYLVYFSALREYERKNADQARRSEVRHTNIDRR